MAGETRRQRRDARRAAGGGASGRSDKPATPGRPSGDAPDGASHEAVAHAPRRGSFVRESAAELRKVDWPNRAQVIQGTVVVIIACAVVGAFLWGADQALRPFVREVLLGQ